MGSASASLSAPVSGVNSEIFLSATVLAYVWCFYEFTVSEFKFDRARRFVSSRISERCLDPATMWAVLGFSHIWPVVYKLDG